MKTKFSVFVSIGMAVLASTSMVHANEGFQQANSVEALQQYQQSCVECADYATAVERLREMQGIGAALTVARPSSTSGADEGYANASAAGNQQPLQQYQAQCVSCDFYADAVRDIRVMNGLESKFSGAYLAPVMFAQPAGVAVSMQGGASAGNQTANAGPDEGYQAAIGNAAALRQYQQTCQTCTHYAEAVTALREGGDTPGNVAATGGSMSTASGGEQAMLAQAQTTNNAAVWQQYQNGCVACDGYADAVSAMRRLGPAARAINVSNSASRSAMVAPAGSASSSDQLSASELTSSAPESQLLEQATGGSIVDIRRYQFNCVSCDGYAETVVAMRQQLDGAGGAGSASGSNAESNFIEQVIAQAEAEGNEQAFVDYQRTCTGCEYYAYAVQARQAIAAGEAIPASPVRPATYIAAIAFAEGLSDVSDLDTASGVADSDTADGAGNVSDNSDSNADDNNTDGVATGVAVADDNSANTNDDTTASDNDAATDDNAANTENDTAAPDDNSGVDENTDVAMANDDSADASSNSAASDSASGVDEDDTAGGTSGGTSGTSASAGAGVSSESGTGNSDSDNASVDADVSSNDSAGNSAARQVEAVNDDVNDAVEDTVDDVVADTVDAADDVMADVATAGSSAVAATSTAANTAAISAAISAGNAAETSGESSSIESPNIESSSGDTDTGSDSDFSSDSNANLQSSLAGHKQTVWVVDFADTGVLASGSGDSTVKLWQTDQATAVKTLRGHRGFIAALDFANSSDRLVSGAENGKVIVWDTVTGEKVNTISGFEGDVAAVASHPDGDLVAIGDSTGVALYDVASGSKDADLGAAPEGVSFVDFSPDGDNIAVTTPLRTVVVDAGGDEVYRIEAKEEQAYAARFSPDGKYLATAGANRIVRLYDASTGKFIRALSKTRDSVLSLAFSADGEWLAAGCADGGIYLYRVSNGRNVKVFAHYGIGVYSVAFSPEGDVLASAAGTRKIKLFDLTEYQ